MYLCASSGAWEKYLVDNAVATSRGRALFAEYKKECPWMVFLYHNSNRAVSQSRPSGSVWPQDICLSQRAVRVLWHKSILYSLSCLDLPLITQTYFNDRCAGTVGQGREFTAFKYLSGLCLWKQSPHTRNSCYTQCSGKGRLWPHKNQHNTDFWPCSPVKIYVQSK